MPDQYQNFPFPTMGSGWHGDTIAPQTLVNPSLASRTGTGITGPGAVGGLTPHAWTPTELSARYGPNYQPTPEAANSLSTGVWTGPGGATPKGQMSWSVSDAWPGGVPGGPGMGPGQTFYGDPNQTSPLQLQGAGGNQPADLGLASRDPAFLQSLANRVMPGMQMNQGAGGNIPSWLGPAMNSLANLPFGGGGYGNQQQQQPMMMMNMGAQPDPANLFRQQLLDRALGQQNYLQTRMNSMSPGLSGLPGSHARDLDTLWNAQNQVSLLAGAGNIAPRSGNIYADANAGRPSIMGGYF